MRALCQLVSLISLLNLKNLCCVVWPTSFEDRFPRHQMKSKQCKLCCSLLLHLLHTKGHTQTHTEGKKSPPKNYHNQLAHVKQVVPKATDQCVCVCACVQHHLHTLDVYVIFSSLFHFEHSFLWQRQFDRKNKKRKEKCIIIIIETFVHVKHHRVMWHVLCNNFNFNDRKFSGICLFIYGMHNSLCIFHLWQVQLQGQTWNEWRKRELLQRI